MKRKRTDNKLNDNDNEMLNENENEMLNENENDNDDMEDFLNNNTNNDEDDDDDDEEEEEGEESEETFSTDEASLLQQQQQQQQHLKISLKLSNNSNQEYEKDIGKEEENPKNEEPPKTTQDTTVVVQKSRKKRAYKKKSLHTVLEKLIQVLQGKDSYGFFLEPVDTKIVTDYLTIIKKPMDLSTMKKKVQKRQYKNLREFQDDFELICSNAKTYNSPDTIYFRQADKLLDIGKRLIEREYPNIAEEDNNENSERLSKKASNHAIKVSKMENGKPNSDGTPASKYSIYRRTPDGGFLFSSLQKTPVLADGSLDPNSEYRSLTVSAALDFDDTKIPTLGEAAFSREKEISSQSMLFPRLLDYNPYMSFEPILDSSKSTISFEDPAFLQLTYGDAKNKAYIDSLVNFSEGQDPFLENYVKCVVATLSAGSSSLVNAVDTIMKDANTLFNSSKALIEPSGIKNSISAGVTVASVATTLRGLDRVSEYEEASQLLQQQPAFLSECMKILDNDISIAKASSEDWEKLLRDTLALLDMLQKHQDYRFLKSEKSPGIIENKIAMRVKENLSTLASLVAPKDLLSSEGMKSIQNLMNTRYVPRDPNYHGSLPPTRPFAYSSNLANASSVPITATMVPVPLVRHDRIDQEKKNNTHNNGANDDGVDDNDDNDDDEIDEDETDSE